MVFLLPLCSALNAEGAFGATLPSGATWRFYIVSLCFSLPPRFSLLLCGFCAGVHHSLTDASYHDDLAAIVLSISCRGRLRSQSVPWRCLAMFPSCHLVCALELE